MLRKIIPTETIELMQELYNNEISVKEIADKLDFSLSMVYNHINKKKRDNVKRLGKKYYDIWAKEKGYKSFNDYRNKWAKEKGRKYFYDYQKKWAKEKGYKSLNDYLKKKAIEKGYASLNDYVEHKNAEKKKRQENKDLSDLIKNTLKETGKSQYWLSKKINVSREMVSLYFHGESIPRHEKLEKIIECFSKEITLKNIEKACKFIIIKYNDKYYLYCNEKGSHKEIFEDYKKIMKNSECIGRGLFSREKKEIIACITNNYGFPKDVFQNLIQDYIKDTNLKDYELIIGL